MKTLMVISFLALVVVWGMIPFSSIEWNENGYVLIGLVAFVTLANVYVLLHSFKRAVPKTPKRVEYVEITVDGRHFYKKIDENEQHAQTEVNILFKYGVDATWKYITREEYIKAYDDYLVEKAEGEVG